MQKVENLSKVTKSVGKTSNSNTYTPSPAIQEKIKDVPKGPITDIKKDLEEIGVSVTEKVMVTNGSVEPKCLSCNSDLWDNRIDKASGKIKNTYPENVTMVIHVSITWIHLTQLNKHQKNGLCLTYLKPKQ